MWLTSREKNAFAFANSKTLVGDESLKFSLQLQSPGLLLAAM